MNIQKNNSISFKSGLNRSILKEIKNIDVAKAQIDFAKMGVDADFRGSKPICANFVYAANVLSDIAGKYKLPFNFVPPAIRVFKHEELIDKNDKALAFCNIDTKKVLKEEEPFVGTSVFMGEENSNIPLMEFLLLKGKIIGSKKTAHFLSVALHEWFHCIHENLIFKKFGYEGSCPILSERYGKEGAKGLDVISIQTNLPFLPFGKVLQKEVGRYAASSRSMFEVFAELMTRITVEALDKNINVIKNPLDNMPKKLPYFYKRKIEEILNI